MFIIYWLIKAKYMLFFALFSLCKMVASMGQTLFSVRCGLTSVFKNMVEENSCDFLSLVAALATLLVVSVTRVPAMYTLFKAVKTDIKSERSKQVKGYQQFVYCALVGFNVISGFFSSVGAYLGIITISEYALGGASFSLRESLFIQMFAIIVSIACFLSFYSFNIQKAKLNSLNLISNLSIKKISILKNKTWIKTFLVSCLNTFSLPFIAYFLTMNAVMKLPNISAYLSLETIQWISIFSAASALISSFTTTLVSMHDFLSRDEGCKQDETSGVSMLRYGTYMAGIVDSGANGLSSFLGVINISKNILKLAVLNNYVIYIAIGCALSSALLNFNFSVRQGFQDVAKLFNKAN